jgi:histidinol dehydrogenase
MHQQSSILARVDPEQMRYLKKAPRSAGSEDPEITAAVAKILQDVESGGEQAARDYAVRFDHWNGDIVVAAADCERAAADLPQQLKETSPSPTTTCAASPTPSLPPSSTQKLNLCRAW